MSTQGPQGDQGPQGPLAVPGIDRTFLKRVYKTSILVAAVVGGVIVLYGNLPWGLGFALAGIWSVANLWSLGKILEKIGTPGSTDMVGLLLALSLKVVLLYGSGLALLFFGDFPPLSLIAGFSVPLLMVVLKTISRLIFTRGASGRP